MSPPRSPGRASPRIVAPNRTSRPSTWTIEVSYTSFPSRSGLHLVGLSKACTQLPAVVAMGGTRLLYAGGISLRIPLLRALDEGWAFSFSGTRPTGARALATIVSAEKNALLCCPVFSVAVTTVRSPAARFPSNHIETVRSRALEASLGIVRVHSHLQHGQWLLEDTQMR